ncbi:MAG: peptidoglycan-associated lipoprotein [Halobacteriovoraceae bacterium]|nr:peptidoglycan-associated lipoprotein [Halobacteriovoraceae bacterium]|tara:strand:- start:39075 stop:39593 length:519 start_codon:yes stop_codon:yes gene_type:complete
MQVLLRKTLVCLTVMSMIFMVSCSSDSKKESESDSASDTLVSDPTGDSNIELNGSSDDSTAGPIKTIYFDFNSSALTSAAKATLSENAEYLKMNEAVTIEVEGHADERGGVQYNLALGEKRANRVKDYLVGLGVASDRITTVSYGKDRPVAYGHDEEAWSKNRRANFVITAK